MPQDNRKQSQKDRDRQNPTQGSNPGRGQGYNPHHSAVGQPGSKRSQQNDPQPRRNQNDDVDDDLMDEDRDDEISPDRDRDRGPSGAGS
jgi:hypothetical protein